MEKLSFNIVIDAPRERVWDVLWNDKTYREWTSVFSPDSSAESDWKEGSKIVFGDGKGSGMVSRIAAKKPNEFMSFEFLGEVNNGVEDLDSEKVKAWKGGHENYTLKDVSGGKTEILVEIDITEEHKQYFSDTWPRALEKLKSLAEMNTEAVTSR